MVLADNEDGTPGRLVWGAGEDEVWLDAVLVSTTEGQVKSRVAPVAEAGCGYTDRVLQSDKNHSVGNGRDRAE